MSDSPPATAPWAPWPDPPPTSVPDATDPGPPNPHLRWLESLGLLIVILAAPVLVAGIWNPRAVWPGASAMTLGAALWLTVGGLNRSGPRQDWRLRRVALANGWTMRWLASSITATGRRGGSMGRKVPVDPLTKWLHATFPEVMAPPSAPVQETAMRLINDALSVGVHDPNAVYVGCTASGRAVAFTLIEVETHLGLAAGPLKVDRRGRKANYGLTYRIFAAFRREGGVAAGRPGDPPVEVPLPPLPGGAWGDLRVQVYQRPEAVWVLGTETIHSDDPEAIARELGAFVGAMGRAAVEADAAAQFRAEAAARP